MYVILLAIMVPAASGLVDCRVACRSCRENKEVPAMVEVYCSMCEECKERRREKFAATTHRDESVNFLPDRVRYEEYPPPPTRDPFIFGPTNDNMIGRIRNEFASADDDGYLRHYNDDHYDERRRRRRRPVARQEETTTTTTTTAATTTTTEDYHRLRPEDIPEGCPTPPVCSDDEQTTPRPVTITVTVTTTVKTIVCPYIKPCKPKTTMPNCCMPMWPCNTNPCPQQSCTCQHSTTTPSAQSKDYIYMYVGVPKKLIKH